MTILKIYNSNTRDKEIFKSIVDGHVGMYVCGPTVSGESHLGHARPYITFDVVYRYLLHLGYKVRYVRNVTDAGHFEEEGREAIDKISTKAQIEKLEPMELVQKYTNLFRWAMDKFNTLPPSIEPTATGHIVEQINMIQDIIKAGYGYEKGGSVYFDVKKYASTHDYGKLSGRVVEDLLHAASRTDANRTLEGQDEKRDQADFALWKAAPTEHIMRWNSPWGEGFPGWHIECSAMATKYLGAQFDIHGGGMDLLFPHHESEIAQSTICNGVAPVRYWMHNNMITLNGRKMGKSYNNVIKLTELFSGDHPLLEKAYSPMTIRFFILQTHYRSTLDFSNEALFAAEKGLKRLMDAYEWLQRSDDRWRMTDDGRESADDGRQMIDDKRENTGDGRQMTDDRRENTGDGGGITDYSMETADQKVLRLLNEFEEFINDDFGTARVLANMFEIVPVINSIKDKNISADVLSRGTFQLLQRKMKTYVEDILGLKSEIGEEAKKINGVMEVLIDLRKEARSRKDWVSSDKIRNQLSELGIILKDEKDGNMSWNVA